MQSTVHRTPELVRERMDKERMLQHWCPALMMIMKRMMMIMMSWSLVEDHVEEILVYSETDINAQMGCGDVQEGSEALNIFNCGLADKCDCFVVKSDT